MSNVVKFKQGKEFQVTDRGMLFPDNMTEKQFFDAGHQLSEIEKGTQWAIGDWYNHIPWGDKQAACQEVDIDYKNASKNGAVCKLFQIPLRGGISFNHHYVLSIGNLTDDQRKWLLSEAESNKWSSAKLAVERDKLLGTYVEPVRHAADLETTLEAALSGVPEKYHSKINKAVTAVHNQMLADFGSAVSAQAKKLVAVERKQLSDMRKELEARDKALTGAFKKVNNILTLSEFKMIRSCLHTDRESTPEQKQKAFVAFQKLLANVDPQSKKRWEA